SNTSLHIDLSIFVVVFLSCYSVCLPHPDLRPFPTRRSSDLSRSTSLIARGVSPSPQVLSRGNVAASTTVTSRPARASHVAVAAPAGPHPTTRTSVDAGRSERGSIRSMVAGPRPAPRVRLTWGGIQLRGGGDRRLCGRVGPRRSTRGDEDDLGCRAIQ